MTLDFRPERAETQNHHRFEVSAAGLGRYAIDVSLPPAADKGDAKYPVILVTDGNILFDMVQVMMHGGFARFGTLLPPSILVGVGYPADEGRASYYARRNFDFHGAWPMTDPLGVALQQNFAGMRAIEGKPDLTMRAGGYDGFMAFLRDELLPSLGTRYPIDPAARHTLVGASSGGHFVLRALYDPTSPFRRYVCISPGFGSAGDSIKRAEAEYAAAHSDLDADLFICCGKVEIDQGPLQGLCRFGSGVTWVAEQLAIRQWPSARIDWEIMNHEDHMSIPLRAISAGLRSVHRRRPGVHDEDIKKASAEMLARVYGSTPGGEGR